MKTSNIAHNDRTDLTKNFQRTDIYNQLHYLLDDVIEYQGKNFPIQLLLTKNSEELIHSFDFDICKIGLRVFCNHNSFKNNNFPTDIAQYITRLEYDDCFISCILDKKLTYHNGGKKEEQVQKELVEHASKIIDKYPDYSVDIFSVHDDNYAFTKDLLDKVVSFTTLNKSLKNKILISLKSIKYKINIVILFLFYSIFNQ